MLLLVNHS